ncbi:MAG TPA: DUF3592 domain-containing protein [Rhodothermales bacterium]|nr:DUF3592 domain-containing protein [Rhodothermales bacterium]
MDKSRGIAWAFVGLGMVALGFGVYMLHIARQSASWPSKEGRIEAVTVEKTTSRRRSSSSSRSTARQKKTRYHVSLVYSYVDGQVHESSRYSIGQSRRISQKYRKREDATQAARAYATGDTITVRYNPADPSEAVIKAGITGATWLPLVFGLLFSGLGAYLYSGIRRKKTAAS